MNKELEETIKILKRRNKILKLDYAITNEDLKAIQTVLKYIDNSISKEVIKEKIEELQKEYELLLEHQNGQESNRTKYLRGKIHMCQELLEQK